MSEKSRGKMRPFQVTWIVEPTFDGTMLREFLLSEKDISRQALTDIKFRGGAIHVNGQPVTVRYTLTSGDRVTVQFPLEVISEYMVPEKLNLEVVYEDDHFIVVNKPPHMPTIPSKYQNTHSLAQGVLFQFKEEGIASTIHVVNRLDRDTSGIVMVAKHRYAHSLMSKQQQKGRLERRYLGLCHGHPAEKTGTVEAPIGRKKGSIIERCVQNNGQFARTHFQVLKYYNSFSLLQLSLDTGRTHQIRVHMASEGHPLLGDDLYGGRRNQIKRQALHSLSLRFYHPFEQKHIELEAPLPDDMIGLIG